MKTWIVDIDGTLALMGDRDPYDWTRVGEDLPNEPVIRVVKALLLNDDLVFMSGRMEKCRKQTELWLDANVTGHFWGKDRMGCLVGMSGRFPLFMRGDDDYRPDEVVKKQLFDEHINGRFDVAGVIDDRDKVVRMWREELGLTCFQVADGEFLWTGILSQHS